MKNCLFIIAIIISVLTFSSCSDRDNDVTFKENLFVANDLLNQEYAIAADKDTTLTSLNGIVLTIEKNTFVDQNGNPVTEQIIIEFKECLSKLDMVLGNMTTLSNGKLLESGGMIYLNATADGQPLEIAKSKAIGVEMPTEIVLKNMQLYEGIETDNGINWANPIPLEKKINEVEVNDIIAPIIEGNDEDDFITKKCNVGYYVKDYNYTGNYEDDNFLDEFKEIPQSLLDKISDICWDGDGIVITKDSIIQIDEFEVALIKMDSIIEVRWPKFTNGGPAIKGLNQFREDEGTNYLFKVKKLGWANIDRLYNDPRTKEIELIVTIAKQNEYDNIYTSMIFNSTSMYLPGYQKEDNSFSFSHGDSEKTSLPVGEETTILVTAYKDDIPFYNIKSFIIKEKQTIDLKLTATTKDELKKELKAKL